MGSLAVCTVQDKLQLKHVELQLNWGRRVLPFLYKKKEKESTTWRKKVVSLSVYGLVLQPQHSKAIVLTSYWSDCETRNKRQSEPTQWNTHKIRRKQMCWMLACRIFFLMQNISALSAMVFHGFVTDSRCPAKLIDQYMCPLERVRRSLFLCLCL